MTIYICTDMEGLAGVDRWAQCLPAPEGNADYQDGREQLTAETNAAVAGCFDAGATEVRVLDGHGYNGNRGFIRGKLDPRAKIVSIENLRPLRWEGLNETVDALAIIGQHAMAGTIHGFLDHTGIPERICRCSLNGGEYGEPSQMALYAGFYGVPLIYTSGDEALCAEMRRLFPHATSTPTKRGTGWETCELYPVQKVRETIRREIAEAVRKTNRSWAWRPAPPFDVSVEFAWSGLADPIARVDGVSRPHARTVQWRITDPRDIYMWPSSAWKPS